ncbi:MAG: hypothetical protein ACI4PE_03765 [Bacilli bacterium]
MHKKVINENTLRKIVRENIENILNEESALALKYYDEPQLNANLINEIARINTDESHLFPYNSYLIQIWSNGHNPPHFNILREDWDVAFFIESGDLYKVNKFGKNEKIYNYMIKNVKEWLSKKCAILPIITNQQNANAIWKQLHQ